MCLAAADGGWCLWCFVVLVLFACSLVGVLVWDLLGGGLFAAICYLLLVLFGLLIVFVVLLGDGVCFGLVFGGGVLLF